MSLCFAKLAQLWKHRRINMRFKLPMMHAPANSPFSWIATIKSGTALPKALHLLDLVKHQRWKNYFARKLRMQSMPSWKENKTGQKAYCWLNYCWVTHVPWWRSSYSEVDTLWLCEQLVPCMERWCCTSWCLPKLNHWWFVPLFWLQWIWP